MTHIAFIGLGRMGGPMAANLAKAGREVRGFDLDPRLRGEAEPLGVQAMGSALAAAQGAAAIVTMLPAGEAVLGVWREVLACVDRPTLFIDCSTIDIASARLAHRLAQDAGHPSVDAPVSGGVAGATAGTLTFMCGGEDSAFEKARGLLADMGQRVIHCGEGGLGQAAKICNNMMLGATMIATCEAFALAERLGLSDRTLFDVASVSSGQSWSLTHYCPAPGILPTSPANADYRPGFMAALMLKDLGLAQAAAESVGLETPLAALAARIYALYVERGEGESDFSGVIRMIREGLPEA
ncbi:3-hydroxyisobutyrate dehydrogenase [Methylocystis bryophila]|uniref:3-hydroxyisobutyrate dehydrogenase n=1 Tax=Methylocystis bryophila TaxID=655015 RepID=A0A1W6MS01_9HYPH|nr:3-hydroxyisobutyrate dehydrogenase [Methylocystis bryophila]ARN80316.1 3-hydroxyisobutyrate dehydrogenase [Methylocystis bryophila]BDV40294.1 3-hydroxyisobutyrate dehydrogenase [Methylocystis bryophila]